MTDRFDPAFHPPELGPRGLIFWVLASSGLSVAASTVGIGFAAGLVLLYFVWWYQEYRNERAFRAELEQVMRSE